MLLPTRISTSIAALLPTAAQTSDQYFEWLVHNNKRSSETPFYDTSCYLDGNFRCINTQPLPTLSHGRVSVIAQSDTCSASKSIIDS